MYPWHWLQLLSAFWPDEGGSRVGWVVGRCGSLYLGICTETLCPIECLFVVTVIPILILMHWQICIMQGICGGELELQFSSSKHFLVFLPDKKLTVQ